MSKISSNRIFQASVFIFLFAMATGDLNAQCAMCKAVAENSIDEGGFGVAVGLNNGILFLMAIPYILLGTLFFVFFRKQIGGFIRAFNNIH